MTCTEAYKEHIEYTFHAFCKIVIRNAGLTALRTWSRKYKREISLTYLTDEKHCPFSTTDEYFKAPEPCSEYLILICGDTLVLSDERLAAALSRLPMREQEMVYLSFFKWIPQHEIARRYGCCRSTAGYHIRKAIGQLYEEMEGMKHKECKTSALRNNRTGDQRRAGSRRRCVAVLQPPIRYATRISGQVDKDAEDYITETFLKALFKFRMDKAQPPYTTE